MLLLLFAKFFSLVVLNLLFQNISHASDLLQIGN